MSRRGPKQSPFIGKRVPLVENGVPILYPRYVDPAEVILEPANKRQKKPQPDSAALHYKVDDPNGVADTANMADKTTEKKDKKKKKKRRLESMGDEDAAASGRKHEGTVGGGIEGVGIEQQEQQGAPENGHVLEKKNKRNKKAKVASEDNAQQEKMAVLQHGKMAADEQDKVAVNHQEKKAQDGKGEQERKEPQEGEEGKKEKKKKKKKEKKQTVGVDGGAAGQEVAVEKKLTSGGGNAEEAGKIRNLLGYKGPKALPVPQFTFGFPAAERPAPASAAPEPELVAATETVEDAAATESGFVPRRVYVGGMPYHWEEEHIKEYWSYCGEVEGLDLMRFPDSGKFRGIAFITFATQAGYEAALQYNGEQVDSYVLKVDKCKASAVRKGHHKSSAVADTSNPGQNHQPDVANQHQHDRDYSKGAGHRNGPSKTPGFNVAYVGNIAFEATRDDLIALFKPYNGYVRLHTDKGSQEHKGYAHVQFADEEHLERAMELDGYKLMSRKIRVGYGQPRKQ